MRIYGNEKTNLVLSEKAEEAYGNSDPLTIVERDDGLYSMTGIIVRDGITELEVNKILEWLYDECFCDDEDEDEDIIEISKIAIKSETFCTTWNDNLYCVDICEDAEERSAWLYNSSYAVKSLMWGEKNGITSREDFLNRVFSNLPYYIDGYEEMYGND